MPQPVCLRYKHPMEIDTRRGFREYIRPGFRARDGFAQDAWKRYIKHFYVIRMRAMPDSATIAERVSSGQTHVLDSI